MGLVCRRERAREESDVGARARARDWMIRTRAELEDGGTITTTEIEFSHQSSRCERRVRAHTHRFASVQAAAIDALATPPKGRRGERRQGEGSGEKGGSERDGEKGEPTVPSFLLLLSRQRGTDGCT